MYITNDDIPEIPFFKTPAEHRNFCNKLIENGAIPKNKLKNKTKYYGGCRNSSYATWDAESQQFYYDRWKLGTVFVDFINHFEDDDGSDLFVPIKEITNNVIEEKIKNTEVIPEKKEEPIIENIRAKKR